MNAGRLLDHYERIADATDAPVHLRRFVLELAVRGKLVSQDPNDEPASELLVRIAAEKSRLVRAGEISKQAAVPKLPDAGPFELPANWAWTQIGAICSKTGSGSTPRGGKSVYHADGVPFLRSQNVYNDGLRLDDVAYIDQETHRRMEGTIVRPGDLLLNITGGSIGRCCIIPRGFPQANISQHVAIIRVSLDGIQKYLHRLVLSPYFQSFVIDEQTGAGRGGLPKNRMDRIPIALPPFAEQERIASKVDELMGLCDRLEEARASREATRDRLVMASFGRLNAPDPATFQADARFVLGALPAFTKRPDHIKQIRETILNLAVRGRLLPHDQDHGAAAKLLEHLARRMDVVRREERGRPELMDSNAFFEPGTFPVSWAITQFDKVNVLASGVAKGKVYGGQKVHSYPYLRVANVQRGYLDLSVVKLLDVPASDLNRYRLQRGDVLMTEGGDWDKLGRAAIWDDEITDCIHQNHIFRIRSADRERLLPAWEMLFANSSLGRSYFEDASKQTTNLASINMTQLRSCPLPLPPTAEQRRIVAKVDELMLLCDRLEASLSAGDDTRRRLLDALLAEALASPHDVTPEQAQPVVAHG